MEKLAIIGTGIAGMGCAYFLNKHFDITVFEQNDYIGGHTNTVYVEEAGKNIPIDTGFIVCNNENYPLLMRLFKKLNVPLKNTSMSFAASIQENNIEYCGSSLNLLFAQRKNIFNPRYLRFLMQVGRFNKECIEVLENKDFHDMSIADYAKQKKLGDDFLNWYILPMSSALWSTEPETTAQFPVLSLVRFFKNHGLLGLDTQFKWFTVDGGSEEYKKLLIDPFKEKIKTSSKIVSIQRNKDAVILKTGKGEAYTFDKVIVAAHADQALNMLSDASASEKEILSPFHYAKNRATLHTDEAVMPKLKKVWSSWNYMIGKKNGINESACTYWMNCLQTLPAVKNYFVTINDHQQIDPAKIIREFIYDHPIFTNATEKAQLRLNELNENDRLYFCGSYFRYGFHEDAFMSAVMLCEKITGKDIWS